MRARALLSMMAACTHEPPVRLEIELPAIDGVEIGAPAIAPADALVSMSRRGALRYEVVVRPTAIEIEAEGACPREIDVAALERDPAGRFIRLAPSSTLAGERAQIGFGERFELTASSGCGTVRWEAVDPIAELAIDGATARGRMPSLEEAGVVIGAAGVVPISPRTAGARALDLVVERGGDSFVRRVELRAAARATGVPSIGVHVRSYLALRDPSDAPLTIARAPTGSSAALVPIAPGIARFEPDVRGRYVFGSGEAYGFSIFAGRHSETPLDCGRGECHGPEARAAATSPMTGVLSRLLEVDSYTPGCAIGCHAAGEPGVRDGGFTDVAVELATALPMHGGGGEYARLPRELRRVSGVGCTTCHGPGAIPEPGARDRVLATDVCAVCHDAPPRYGHVVSWRETAMARPDESEALRSAPCARCHTTAGFAGVDVEIHRAEIACAACHSVHSEESGPALTRVVPIADGIGGPIATGPSRVCVACHSPDPGLDLPSASAVALMMGRFSFGSSVAAPHATLERGCLACHGTETSELERGAGHRFGVAANVCAGCHADDVAEPRDFRARLDALVARFEPGSLGRDRATEGAWPSDEPGHARWNAALLAGDRAAWAHGGPHATSLLDTTEHMLGPP
jgi:hypothetical protein